MDTPIIPCLNKIVTKLMPNKKSTSSHLNKSELEWRGRIRSSDESLKEAAKRDAIDFPEEASLH